MMIYFMRLKNCMRTCIDFVNGIIVECASLSKKNEELTNENDLIKLSW